MPIEFTWQNISVFFCALAVVVQGIQLARCADANWLLRRRVSQLEAELKVEKLRNRIGVRGKEPQL